MDEKAQSGNSLKFDISEPTVATEVVTPVRAEMSTPKASEQENFGRQAVGPTDAETGGRQVQMARVRIRRSIEGNRFRITERGSQRFTTINTKGFKVVGILAFARTIQDQAIKSYTRFFGLGDANQSANPAFLQSLTDELVYSRAGVISVDAPVDKHIYLAQPVELGVPLLTYNGLSGGFREPRITVISINGVPTDYYVYESYNDNLGETTIRIK